MQKNLKHSPLILTVFTVSILYWIYLAFICQMYLWHDARGYEGLGELLYKKGVLVVPDFVANAGGVISSYVEYIGGNEKKMCVQCFNPDDTLDVDGNKRVETATDATLLNRYLSGLRGADLIADADAESKVHKIPYLLDYVDNIGNAYSKNGTIGLVVNEIPEYSVNLEDVDIYTSDQKGKIVVSVSNIGSSEIKFMEVTLQESSEYTLLSPATVYIGNIDEDDYESASVVLEVASDTTTVPVRISYKDALNRQYEEQYDLQLRLGEGNNGSSNSWTWAVVIIVVLVGGWWFFRKRRRK